MAASVAKWQTLRDAVHISRMDGGRSTKAAAALGTLGLAQVAPARAGAQNLAPSRYLKPLGHRFLGLDAFWTSHKSYNFLSKRARNIGIGFLGSKRYF
jgi:hypothetical protein